MWLPRVMMALAATGAAGCGHMPGWLGSEDEVIQVQEVRRSQQCGTEGPDARLRWFPSNNEVRELARAGATWLDRGDPLPPGSFVLVEMGARNTGGYVVAVSRNAVRRGSTVILHATFVSPAPDQMVAQVFTSPCALVALPAGRYRKVEVLDQAGTLRTALDVPR